MRKPLRSAPKRVTSCEVRPSLAIPTARLSAAPPGKFSTLPGASSTASMMASPMLKTEGMNSLKIGVAMKHHFMRVRHLACEAEYDAVEQHQAGLLEQAAAELLGCFDWHRQNNIGDRCQC